MEASLFSINDGEGCVIVKSLGWFVGVGKKSAVEDIESFASGSITPSVEGLVYMLPGVLSNHNMFHISSSYI